MLLSGCAVSGLRPILLASLLHGFTDASPALPGMSCQGPEPKCSCATTIRPTPASGSPTPKAVHKNTNPEPHVASPLSRASSTARQKSNVEGVAMLAEALGDAKISSDDEFSSATPIARLPLTKQNIAALIVTASFAILGGIYAWMIATRRKCGCKLCRREYMQKKVLGKGGFGEVFLVRRSKDKKEFVLKKSLVANVQEANLAQDEAKELRRLKHPYIVQYEDDFLCASRSSMVSHGTNSDFLCVCIVMELCETDLGDVIRANIELGTRIEEDEIWRVLSQLCQALKFCHAHKMLHLDIKADNVFLKGEDVRLGDFGLAKAMQKVAASYSLAGTSSYMSPEMLLGDKLDGKADVWGLGVLLYELLTLKSLDERPGCLGSQVMAHGGAVDDLVADVDTVQFSGPLRKLLWRLLQPDPTKRPSVDELLKKKQLQPRGANKRHDHDRPLREPKHEPPSVNPKINRRERRRSSASGESQ